MAKQDKAQAKAEILAEIQDAPVVDFDTHELKVIDANAKNAEDALAIAAKEANENAAEAQDEADEAK